MVNFAEISRNFRDTDDTAVVVSDRRHGERNGNDPTVLALPLRRKMVDPFAATDPGEDRRFLVDQIPRNDARNRLADHLVSRIAEHRFGRLVPGRDDAVQVFADHCVVRRFSNRRKPKTRVVV